MPTEPATDENSAKQHPDSKGNSQHPPKGAAQPRVISDPKDVAQLVLMQVDAINAKKDNLTIAIKGLTDLTKQLVRAYAEQQGAIQKLQERVNVLQDKSDA